MVTDQGLNLQIRNS